MSGKRPTVNFPVSTKETLSNKQAKHAVANVRKTDRAKSADLERLHQMAEAEGCGWDDAQLPPVRARNRGRSAQRRSSGSERSDLSESPPRSDADRKHRSKVSWASNRSHPDNSQSSDEEPEPTGWGRKNRKEGRGRHPAGLGKGRNSGPADSMTFGWADGAGGGGDTMIGTEWGGKEEAWGMKQRTQTPARGQDITPEIVRVILDAECKSSCGKMSSSEFERIKNKARRDAGCSGMTMENFLAIVYVLSENQSESEDPAECSGYERGHLEKGGWGRGWTLPESESIMSCGPGFCPVIPGAYGPARSIFPIQHLTEDEEHPSDRENVYSEIGDTVGNLKELLQAKDRELRELIVARDAHYKDCGQSVELLRNAETELSAARESVSYLQKANGELRGQNKDLLAELKKLKAVPPPSEQGARIFYEPQKNFLIAADKPRDLHCVLDLVMTILDGVLSRFPIKGRERTAAKCSDHIPRTIGEMKLSELTGNQDLDMPLGSVIQKIRLAARTGHRKRNIWDELKQNLQNSDPGDRSTTSQLAAPEETPAPRSKPASIPESTQTPAILPKPATPADQAPQSPDQICGSFRIDEGDGKIRILKPTIADAMANQEEILDRVTKEIADQMILVNRTCKQIKEAENHSKEGLGKVMTVQTELMKKHQSDHTAVMSGLGVISDLLTKVIKNQAAGGGPYLITGAGRGGSGGSVPAQASTGYSPESLGLIKKAAELKGPWAALSELESGKGSNPAVFGESATSYTAVLAQISAIWNGEGKSNEEIGRGIAERAGNLEEAQLLLSELTAERKTPHADSIATGPTRPKVNDGSDLLKPV